MDLEKGLISKRKDEHIDICLKDNVDFVKSNGFENYDFIHDALTEVVIEDINFETQFLGKNISSPFLISSMTGGTERSKSINEQLAVAANELNIPIAVGSQRVFLDNPQLADTFKIVRDKAPKVPVLSNIGAAQIVTMKSIDDIKNIVETISADGLIIHLNPLQELLQQEGEINFKGLFKKIIEIKQSFTIPIVVKEVGSGISQSAARKLLDAGVDIIDVAGAGGTSWAAVELQRNPSQKNSYFREWGLRTSFCVREIAKLKNEFNFTLVSSGGVHNFLDAAKSFALGADMFASAKEVLKTVNKSGADGVINLINGWFNGIKNIMFLTGSKNINDLRKDKLRIVEELF
ncbi:MAG: type 2 isopentenyl-diphosphate Delta-isomerase [Bacteroidota bacterium]